MLFKENYMKTINLRVLGSKNPGIRIQWAKELGLIRRGSDYQLLPKGEKFIERYEKVEELIIKDSDKRKSSLNPPEF